MSAPRVNRAENAIPAERRVFVYAGSSGTWSGAAILDAYHHDPDICRFVRTARVGESAMFGGGDVPIVGLTRVR